MNRRILASEPYITIAYDVVEDILHADWTGDQTKESVMSGCEKMLHSLTEHHCSRVLNDNTRVTSFWDDASEWVAVDWFPRMRAAGCRLFAWVYSPNLYSKLSTDKTLGFDIRGILATTFGSRDTAVAWLRAMG